MAIFVSVFHIRLHKNEADTVCGSPSSSSSSLLLRACQPQKSKDSIESLRYKGHVRLIIMYVSWKNQKGLQRLQKILQNTHSPWGDVLLPDKAWSWEGGGRCWWWAEPGSGASRTPGRKGSQDLFKCWQDFSWYLVLASVVLDAFQSCAFLFGLEEAGQGQTLQLHEIVVHVDYWSTHTSMQKTSPSSSLVKSFGLASMKRLVLKWSS